MKERDHTMNRLAILLVLLWLCTFTGCAESMEGRLEEATTAELQVDQDTLKKVRDARFTSEIMEALGVKRGMKVAELEQRIGKTYDIIELPDGLLVMGYYLRGKQAYRGIFFTIDPKDETVTGMIPHIDGVLEIPPKSDRIEKPTLPLIDPITPKYSPR